MIVAALVVSVVAMFVSGRALSYARRQTDEAARSRLAAETSANAAVGAAKVAARQPELAEAEAAKYVPPWTLRWDPGDTYLLANDGDSTEYVVTLNAADELIARMPEAGKTLTTATTPPGRPGTNGLTSTSTPWTTMLCGY